MQNNVKKILVLGGNFAGVTAALEIKRKLKNDVEVTVVAPSERFLYVPSLIWVPFGRRKFEDISFPVAPMLEKKGVKFILDKANKIEPDKNSAVLEKFGEFSYDYIVIATGVSLKWDGIEGFDPKLGFNNCIVTPPLAEETRKKFEELVKNPGPIVVGASQGASCMGAAYEFLFNIEKELRKRKVRDKVDITWVTPEPFLGHFGIGGVTGGQTMLEAFMKMFKMNYKTEVGISKFTKDEVTLSDGTKLPYKLAMIIPPFRGAEAVKNSPKLTDENGFVPTDDGYRHVVYKNVFSAGLAVQVKAPFGKCSVPFGVPKTGFPSDVMGKIVADNILNDIKANGKYKKMPFGKIPGICIMDAGNKEVWIITNHLFKPRGFEIMIPNIFYNFGKLILEKYMLWKNRYGLSYLP